MTNAEQLYEKISQWLPSEVATGGILKKKLFLKISQDSEAF